MKIEKLFREIGNIFQGVRTFLEVGGGVKSETWEECIIVSGGMYAPDPFNAQAELKSIHFNDVALNIISVMMCN